MEPSNDYHQNRHIILLCRAIVEHFTSNRGVATTSLRTGLAMTGSFDKRCDKHQFIAPLLVGVGSVDNLGLYNLYEITIENGENL